MRWFLRVFSFVGTKCTTGQKWKSDASYDNRTDEAHWTPYMMRLFYYTGRTNLVVETKSIYSLGKYVSTSKLILAILLELRCLQRFSDTVSPSFSTKTLLENSKLHRKYVKKSRIITLNHYATTDHPLSFPSPCKKNELTKTLLSSCKIR